MSLTAVGGEVIWGGPLGYNNHISSGSPALHPSYTLDFVGAVVALYSLTPHLSALLGGTICNAKGVGLFHLRICHDLTKKQFFPLQNKTVLCREGHILCRDIVTQMKILED